MHDSVAQNSRKKYPVIDICKLYCAFLIVFMHCVEVKNGHLLAYSLSKCCTQQAVPFFFIVSGFLYARKNKCGASGDNKQIFRYLVVYFIWMLIWSPIVIHRYFTMYSGRSVLYILMVILRRILFAGEGVYWYLLVLFESLFMINLAQKYRKMNILIGISVVFFILGLWYENGSSIPIMQRMFSAIYFVFSWTNNVLMKGLPYTLIGYCLYRHVDKIRHYKKMWLITAYLVVLFANITIYLNTSLDKMHIFIYPVLACILFLISVNEELNDFVTKDTKTLRNLSTVIYLTHTLFIYYVADPLVTAGGPIPIKYVVAVGLSMLTFLIIRNTENRYVKKVFMIS